MKEIVLSLLLFVSSTIQQREENTKLGTCIYDQIDPSKAICACPLEDVALPNDIFLNITTLELYCPCGKNPVGWLLKDINSFTRFSKLKKLNITSHITLSTKIIPKAKKELLNIETLSHLTINNCFYSWNKSWIGFEDKWIPPPNVQYLDFYNCAPQYFDWTNISSLKNVTVRYTYLSSLSEFLNPSARSLEYLHLDYIHLELVNISDIYNKDNLDVYVFEIYDVAFLCHLKEFSIDGKGLQKNKYYCECKRYLDWQKFLADNAKVNLIYKTDLEDQKVHCAAGNNNMDCSKYTLEEAKQNRTKCLNLDSIVTTTTSLITTMLPPTTATMTTTNPPKTTMTTTPPPTTTMTTTNPPKTTMTTTPPPTTTKMTTMTTTPPPTTTKTTTNPPTTTMTTTNPPTTTMTTTPPPTTTMTTTNPPTTTPPPSTTMTTIMTTPFTETSPPFTNTPPPITITTPPIKSSTESSTNTTTPSTDEKLSFWDQSWFWVKNLPTYGYVIAALSVFVIVFAFLTLILAVKVMRSSSDAEDYYDEE